MNRLIGGGQAGGLRWALGVGGKPKVGNNIHNETDSSYALSVEHRNCHSQPGSLRRSFAAVRHNMQLY